MDNTNKLIIDVVEKLKRYKKSGGMDEFEIEEIIQKIMEAYNDENKQRIDKMMDTVTKYIVETVVKDNQFEQYVKANIEIVASLIDKSTRTVYRKLKENSFTLIEKQKINEAIDNDKY